MRLLRGGNPSGPPARACAGRRNGFTFIEALVVAVIFGILAAVAIPTYTGYIASQKKSAAKSIAQSGATSANIFYRRNNIDPTPAQLRLFLSDSSRYQILVRNNHVVVVDTSNSSQPVRDSAKYR